MSISAKIETQGVREVNFDCLVGPTHHFGGLSIGNIASSNNQARLSHPKKAALQGLEKMRFLAERGFKQAILPPHPRPHLSTLSRLGFRGSEKDLFKQAYQTMPQLFSQLCSSSAMWAANMAMVSPSLDSADHKVHITPANLITMFHRSIESDFNYKLFSHIFNNKYFIVHEPLPAHDIFSDEGAANHNRLCPSHAHKGLEIFVHGKTSSHNSQKTRIFPARQSQLANEAMIRLHQLDPQFSLDWEQNPEAIDHGAFHNDVVSVANESVLLVHEQAFTNQKQVLNNLTNIYYNLYKSNLNIIEISSKELSLKDAVDSYLFNSQILTKPDGSMLLLAPQECQENIAARQVITKLIKQNNYHINNNIINNNIINEVAFFDIKESMANGGGPACLRLRMVLNTQEQASIHPSLWFSDKLYIKLINIINKYYINNFSLDLLFKHDFYQQSQQALREIYLALDLTGIYDC